jgi:tetratricopeptide (TPR) repeat protein
MHLLGEDFEDEMRDGESKKSVAATFAITFEQIRKSDPRAADILSMMSILDIHAIPTSLLTLDEDVISTEALRTLEAFSVIVRASQQEQEDQCFYIHPLVRLAMHKWLSVNRELKLWVRKAIIYMSEQFPEGRFENLDICRAYLPHALVVLSSDEILHDDSLDEIIQPLQEASREVYLALAALQLNISRHYETIGDFQSAAPMAQASLASRETMLGKTHPDTLASMHRLASALQCQGKFDEAEKMGWQTLRLREKMLSTEHSDILASMHSLTLVLTSQGKFDEAKKMGWQTLRLREKMLSTEHPDILASMDYLTLVLGKQGKLDEAEKMGRQTRSLQEKVLSTEHPDTLDTVLTLTWVCRPIFSASSNFP